MRNLTLGIVLLLIAFNSFSQGPVDGFYKGKGNLDLGVSAGSSLNKKFFAGNELITLKRNISNVSVFAGFGVSEKFDVYFSVPFIKVNDEQSIQDASAYLKHRLFIKEVSNGKIQLSLAAGFLSNLVDYQTEGGSAVGQEAKVIDIRPVLHYARSSGWFYTLQGAYLYKSDPVPSAMNFSIKAGKAAANYYFDFWYAYQYSFGGLDYRGDPTPATFRELGVDYHQIGGTYYRPLTDYLGAFAGASASIAGRNTVKGLGANLGVVFKL